MRVHFIHTKFFFKSETIEFSKDKKSNYGKKRCQNKINADYEFRFACIISFINLGFAHTYSITADIWSFAKLTVIVIELLPISRNKLQVVNRVQCYQYIYNLRVMKERHRLKFFKSLIADSWMSFLYNWD